MVSLDHASDQIGAVPDMSSEYKTQAELKKKADEDAKIGITRTSDGISSSPGAVGGTGVGYPLRPTHLYHRPNRCATRPLFGSYLYVGRVLVF